MTASISHALNQTPESVITTIDTINAHRGWPGRLAAPCPGHMSSPHEPIDGIEVTIGAPQVEFRIADVLVGAGPKWRAIGNAYVECHLPHSTPTDPYVSALHQDGALNAFQLHLLTHHGTHHWDCTSWARDTWCRLCQTGTRRPAV
ncbi:hypothetical protein [Nonomuraea sp. NPDC049784]|uniref:hypothetical protein n=1 Tax=Nonomuraea sp. NPDC049784 TaxID=3154361 RepID=UPI0033CB5CDF